MKKRKIHLLFRSSLFHKSIIYTFACLSTGLTQFFSFSSNVVMYTCVWKHRQNSCFFWFFTNEKSSCSYTFLTLLSAFFVLFLLLGSLFGGHGRPYNIDVFVYLWIFPACCAFWHFISNVSFRSHQGPESVELVFEVWHSHNASLSVKLISQ